MAKQSKSQKDTVERVMHEFKHGELETGTGRKVTNPRQAIAIGLSEAGASNQRSSADNKLKERESKTRERNGDTARDRAESSATKAELYKQAREKDIPGRSKMSKAELGRALKR